MLTSSNFSYILCLGGRGTILTDITYDTYNANGVLSDIVPYLPRQATAGSNYAKLCFLSKYLLRFVENCLVLDASRDSATNIHYVRAR